MELFDLLSKYSWILAIIATWINWLGFRKRAQKHIKMNPQLQEGYEVLFQGYLLWMNLPWVVVGIGCTIGGIPSAWHYFRPRSGNPYVLAWFGSVILVWVLGTHWLFFKGGAEMLAQHPGALEVRYGLKRKEISSPRAIKRFWLLALAGGIIAFVMMWLDNTPVSTFPYR